MTNFFELLLTIKQSIKHGDLIYIYIYIIDHITICGLQELKIETRSNYLKVFFTYRAIHFLDICLCV